MAPQATLRLFGSCSNVQNGRRSPADDSRVSSIKIEVWIYRRKMCGEQRHFAGTEGDQARWTLARKAQEMLRYGQSGQSVKTSTWDISVAYDAMGDWDFEGRAEGPMAPRGACQRNAPEVTASRRYREDISAPRDVRAMPVHHVMVLFRAQKVACHWLRVSSSKTKPEQ
jgi:hypothetical protein